MLIVAHGWLQTIFDLSQVSESSKLNRKVRGNPYAANKGNDHDVELLRESDKVPFSDVPTIHVWHKDLHYKPIALQAETQHKCDQYQESQSAVVQLRTDLTQSHLVI